MLIRLCGVLFVLVSVYCFSVGCVIAALYKRHDYTPNRVWFACEPLIGELLRKKKKNLKANK